MASDAHAHPWYLARWEQDCEAERARLGIRCASSAFAREEFLANEKSARPGGVALCFAVHPQLPARGAEFAAAEDSLEFLDTLAREGRLAAVGELGFDLYDVRYKATETAQTVLFERQLRAALQYGLPAVLHIRRAMRLVFRYTRELARLPAVIFHSFSGSEDEARSLLRRGINAYFSFSLTLTRERGRAARCCAALEAGRLLGETDAPYQSPRGQPYTSYRDIFRVIESAARLRGISAREFEAQIDRNWDAAFGIGGRNK